jgi:tRNA A64-2'-O-ribosylphosphate transferase
MTSNLIFSELAINVSKTLSSLKKSTLTISNRLRSIIDDSEFVCGVAEAYGLPLVANERCGSWYIPPENKAGSAYFKSTDGHTGQWSFSLRRLNLQVLHLVAENDGYV